MNSRIFVVGFFALMLGFLLFRVDYFPFLVFDEKYYVKAAREIYAGRVDPNYQHPIMGKWLLSLPLYIYPENSVWSWRTMPVLFGFISMVVMYLYARAIGLQRLEACVVTLMLLLSGGWYVLSRIGMLEVFANFFILLSAYFLFNYMQRNNFSTEFRSYRDHRYFFLASIILGLSISVKWTGMFVMLFYAVLFLIYFAGAIWKKILFFMAHGVLVFGVYTIISIVLMSGNYGLFLDNIFRSLVTHTEELSANNVAKSDKYPVNIVETYNIQGGVEGFSNFLFRSVLLRFEMSESEKYYGMSNNQFVPVYFLIFSLLIILSVVSVVVRAVQQVPFERPVFVSDPTIVFHYMYAFFLFVPWAFTSRVQYNYYYVAGFPFVLLMVSYYVFKFSSNKLKVLYLVAYFAFSLYRLPFWMPI